MELKLFPMFFFQKRSCLTHHTKFREFDVGFNSADTTKPEKWLQRKGQGNGQCNIFGILHEPGNFFDSFSYARLLQHCINVKSLAFGKLSHAHMITTGFQPGIFIQTNLINLYGKAGCVLDARNVFDNMPERNWVTWTAIISVYSQKGYSNEALGIFREMQRAGRRPDQFTFGSVLRACSELAVVETGEQVHTHVVKSGFEGDIYAGSALVDMYLKCGIMDDARKVFDRMQKKDVVLWTALITGYALNQLGLKALNAFCQMQSTGLKGNEFTFASVVGVCSSLAALDQGKEVHGHIIKNGFESEVCVGSVLIDMYGKCGHMDDALKLFEKMPEKDMISWTAVIGGYAQNDFSEEAMKLFCQMLQAGMKANQFTFASVLMSCARLSVLEQGKQFHTHILKMTLESDVFVGSALVDMYAKCGSIGDARNVFDKIVARNIVSWNSMISGYAQHGHSKEALVLCEQMQEEGTKPDDITFIAVLSACSHVGKLDDGLRYFDLMSEQYGISPRMEHYACIVDLLGRAGKLDEAEKLINAMPSVPSSVVWQSLLGCCRIHKYTELGIWAAKSLIDLEPHNSATYVSLSNIYAAAGMWEEVGMVRQLMKDRGLKKEPGHSWIEIKNRVNLFVAGDRSHLQAMQIDAKLEKMTVQMKERGYVPAERSDLYSVGDEEGSFYFLT